MFTNLELLEAIRINGTILPGQDQWVATIRDDGEKDFCQIGNKYHVCGKSHVDGCGGYPGWGDSGNGCSLHIVYKKQKEE